MINKVCYSVRMNRKCETQRGKKNPAENVQHDIFIGKNFEIYNFVSL